MSKPSAPKILMPAVWVTAIAIAAIGVFVAGSSHVRVANLSAAGANSVHSANAETALSAEQRGRIRAGFGALPLAFEANQGQTDPQVKYIARGSGYTAFLTGNETRFVVTSAHAARKLASRKTANEKIESAAIDMRLVGASSEPAIIAGNQVPGVINYYVGNDQSKWQLGVKQYANVSYRGVYPGVNMSFHAQQRQMEFDFIVSHGTDPAVIGMAFSGARKLATDASGNLVLSSAAGDVVLHKPVAYQEKDGKRELVDAAFQLESENEVTFRLGSYDRDRELVIDPSLSYATYLGGLDEDEAFGIALDASGNTYITGQTNSVTFNGKAAGPTFNVFLTKLNAAGTAFAYTDILAASGTGVNCSSSGTGSCSGNAVAVDGSGNAYVAGSATAGFPTLSAFQTTFGGGASDGFVLKVNTSGTLVYSTYLGGSNSDTANAIAVDGSGNAYVVGETHSTNFPTVSPIQGTNTSGDSAFVTKVNSSGATLAYSTYLGGSNQNLGTGVALDNSGNAYVAGVTVSSDFPTTSGVAQSKFGGVEDGFVTEVKADGSAWVYSTFVGGSGTDDALAIAVDGAGEAYVTGDTTSSNFPTVNAAQQALGGTSATNVFITKLSAGGTAFLFSTYYGGNLDDAGTGIALDSFGDAYVTGRATSSNYPTSGSPFQASLKGSSDAFVTEFSNTGFVEYSSYLGGTGTENDALSGSDTQGPIGAIAVDSSSNAYVAGSTASTTQFPVTGSAAQGAYGGGLADGFVAKVGPAPADFSVAVSPTAATVSAGATTSAITVTVSSVNASFGQAVALSCSGLPSKAACNFSAASVTPSATPGTSNLTISTTSNSSASLLEPSSNRHLTVLASLLLPVLGIAVIGSGVGPRRKKLLGLLLVGIVLMGLVTLPACGSGSNGGGGGGGSGTPAGQYSITVSGAAGGTTHSTTFILSVQ